MVLKRVLWKTTKGVHIANVLVIKDMYKGVMTSVTKTMQDGDPKKCSTSIGLHLLVYVPTEHTKRWCRSHVFLRIIC